MKGFPKSINTGQDLLNCLALYKAGELEKEDIQREIERIESRAFIRCPIQELSTDRKTATIRYCNEAASGQTVNGAVISGIQHTTGEDEQPEFSVITLNKALTADTEVLLIPSPVDPLAALDMTQAQFDSVKEALA